METHDDFGHEHPLQLYNEKKSYQSKASPTHGSCSRCGEEILSGPSFRCSDSKCGFYLHKECKEAPSRMNHPFHRNHSLSLLPTPPANKKYNNGFRCDFCGNTGQMFVYHCSDCDVDLHIKCALFTKKLAHCKDPSVSTEVASNAKCFGCWEPLLAADSTCYSPGCGFNLHQKCADLPFQIDYPGDHKHPLTLQFSGEILSCVICRDGKRRGFFYCCSLCDDFVIHIACMSWPSVIEDKSHHPHPFTLFKRHMSLSCDACGVKEDFIPYMCSSCNLLVHKKCISLPPTIKLTRHKHPISHTYSVQRSHESGNLDCAVCFKEVNTEHGSYYCSDCHFIVHVNCGHRDLL